MSRPPMELRATLALALWAGLLAGYLDVLALQIRRLVVEPLVFVGRHVVWTAPLADAVLFVGLGAGAWLLGRLVPTLGRRGVCLWGFAAIALMGALYSFPALHRLAALALSAGFATLVVRTSTAHGERFEQMVRRSLPWLAGGTAAIAVGMVGWQALQERRALARLPVAPAGTPNVLLIVLDTVRSLNLSLYGYTRETTPELTAWARSGTRFEWATATAPWTLPSHGSLMTGRWVHEMSADWMVPLDTRDSTLAEVLGQAGWATGGFVANTDYASAEVGLARGFAHYEDYTLTPGQIARSSALGRAIARVRPLRRLVGSEDNLGRRLASDISGRFLRWVDHREGRPFFAFLNYYDAHRPYLPPAPYADRFQTAGVPLNPRIRKEHGEDRSPPQASIQGAIDAYDGAIAYLDAEMGNLFRELERRGLGANTLVILTADHGEEFFEHGVWDHGNTLYLPSVRVPLVMRWPGRIPADRSVSQPVSIRNVPASILALVRGNSDPFPGAPLTHYGTAGEVTDTVLSEVRQVVRQPEWYPVSAGNMTAVMAGPWRYIRSYGSAREELYRMKDDPDERHDLASSPLGTAILPSLRALSDGLFDARSHGK